MTPIFKVVKKNHAEKTGDNHAYQVVMRSPEGHMLRLVVGNEEFEGYMVGDTVSVEWGPYQRKLEEAAR